MLKVGDKIKDNDPRMDLRVLRVEEIRQPHCIARNVHGGPSVKILLKRIYIDRKQRRSGFSLITVTP